MTAIIRKTGPVQEPPPLLENYAAARQSFSWEAVAKELGVPLGGPLNLGDLAVRRGGSLVWHGAAGRGERYDTADLLERSGRFAGLLKSLEVAPGERALFMTRTVPELLIALLGSLRAGVVPVVMGRVRNVDAVRNLLERTTARVALIEADTRAALAPLRPQLPELRNVIVLSRDGKAEPPEAGEVAWHEGMERSSPDFESVALPPDAPAYLHYTDLGMSGAVYAHRAAFSLASSASMALDLRPGEGIITLAVPGDTLFIPYLLLAPLLVGATTHAFEEPARYNRWASFTDRVEVWYSAMRAIDVVLRADPGLGTLLNRCRHIAVTHPYDASFLAMTEHSYGSPLHPTWYPRELGSIQTAAFRAEDIAIGTLGRPLPGIEMKVDSEGGGLAVQVNPATPFTGYWNDPELTARRLRNGWFLTEAQGKIEADGSAWLVS